MNASLAPYPRARSAKREGERGGGESEDDNGQLPGEAVHLPDEGRLERPYGTDERAYAPELGVGAGGNRDPCALAGGDEGSGKGHAGAITERRVGCDRRDGFLHCHGLAGEHGLVDAQVARAQQAQVGRNPVAGLDQHDVTGNDRVGGDGRAMAVAHDGGFRIDHGADGVEGLFRASLLQVADGCVDDDDRENDCGVDGVAEQQRQHPGGDEDVDEQVVELHQQALPGAAPRRLRQAVRTEPGAQVSDLFVAEARAPARERRQCRSRGLRVPGRIC